MAVPEPDARPARPRRSRSDRTRATRPIGKADTAQARLFDVILEDEIAELDALIASAEASWARRRERGIADDQVPEALVRLRETATEARRLLDALRDRFAHDE